MADCTLRLPHEDFCKDCPLRPVLNECARKGYSSRLVHALPFSKLARLAIFLLSALVILITPVVVQSLYNLELIQTFSDLAMSALWSIIVPMTVVVILAALYGMYAAIFTKRSGLTRLT